MTVADGRADSTSEASQSAFMRGFIDDLEFSSTSR